MRSRAFLILILKAKGEIVCFIQPRVKVVPVVNLEVYDLQAQFTSFCLFSEIGKRA